MRILVNKWRIVKCDILTIIVSINNVVKIRIDIKIDIIIV